MPVEAIEIGEPFFGIRFVTDEALVEIGDRSIVLNLGEAPIVLREQTLDPLRSVIVQNCEIANVEKAAIVERFEHADDTATMTAIREKWPSAFEMRGEERLRGVEHYMSPKIWIDRIGLTIYHSASVPLNVGLHKDHPFCPVPGFREVHTQLMGIGKMQQCREKDINTLYLEEPMAPGVTHTPMFDEEGNYPWHQFETTTPSVFMAVEMLPEGATPPGALS